jgi:hypothetical protein
MTNFLQMRDYCTAYTVNSNVLAFLGYLLQIPQTQRKLSHVNNIGIQQYNDLTQPNTSLYFIKMNVHV